MSPKSLRSLTLLWKYRSLDDIVLPNELKFNIFVISMTAKKVNCYTFVCKISLQFRLEVDEMKTYYSAPFQPICKIFHQMLVILRKLAESFHWILPYFRISAHLPSYCYPIAIPGSLRTNDFWVAWYFLLFRLIFC